MYVDFFSSFRSLSSHILYFFNVWTVFFFKMWVLKHSTRTIQLKDFLKEFQSVKGLGLKVHDNLENSTKLCSFRYSELHCWKIFWQKRCNCTLALVYWPTVQFVASIRCRPPNCLFFFVFFLSFVMLFSFLLLLVLLFCFFYLGSGVMGLYVLCISRLYSNCISNQPWTRHDVDKLTLHWGK